MEVFVALLASELTFQWIKVSSCLLVHREFKNPCLISIHGRVSELQTFLYVTVTKEFTDDLSSWEKTIPWWIYKFMETTN